MLDSGLDSGLELPFTCRGGICGACVGKVTEGEVDMSDVRAWEKCFFVHLISRYDENDKMCLLCRFPIYRSR